MTPFRFVFPFLNEGMTTFSGPPLLLADGVYIRTVDDGVYSAFHRYNEASSIFNFITIGKTKCVYVDCELNEETDGIGYETYVSVYGRRLRTLLNLLADEGSALFGPIAVMKNEKKLSVLSVVQDESASEPLVKRNQKFRFKSHVDRQVVAETYRIIDSVSEAYSKSFVTLDRYNSSLIRNSWEDRLIDATIALESLISGKTELRFKFSLYLSHVVENSPEQRISAFKLFQETYDARSILVHGSSEKNDNKRVDKVRQNWEQVATYLHKAINYYLFYLYYHDKPEWDTHLKNLVFKVESKIVG